MKPELLHHPPEPIAADTWMIPTLDARSAGGSIGAQQRRDPRGRAVVIRHQRAVRSRQCWPSLLAREPEECVDLPLAHDTIHLGTFEAGVDLCGKNATLIAQYERTGASSATSR